MNPSADWWRPTRAIATWLTWLLVAQAAGQFAARCSSTRRRPWLRMHGRSTRCSTIATPPRGGSSSAASDGTDQTLTSGARLRDARRDRPADHLGLAERAQRPGARAERGAAVARAGRSPGGSSRSPTWCCRTSSSPTLWRSSGAGRGARRRVAVAARRRRWSSAWWVAYVGAQLLTPLAVVLAVTGVTGRSAHRGAARGGARRGRGGAAAHASWWCARSPTARRRSRRSTRRRPTRPAPRQYHAPTTADGPGWYDDPAGQFDHRYWDGSEWTEHVSRAGVASTAPVTPPDWYPDPTGRFHWRYWTGTEWTEHVSRDQELFVDPID